ncbi:hypothetical protein L1887_39305 [Cichorium endivia]|nr:hypothetical protein L1887_39305 [Cichorium endivia]
MVRSSSPATSDQNLPAYALPISFVAEHFAQTDTMKNVVFNFIIDHFISGLQVVADTLCPLGYRSISDMVLDAT